MITAINMKRMGYVAGTPDLLVFEPRARYSGLMIEMKGPKGKVSPAQAEFIEALGKRGYKAVVCFGFQSAQREIDAYFKQGFGKGV
jgi:hypothetical protein